MRHIKIVILLVIFPLLISLSACGKSPEKARKELAQMNVEYTKEKFLEYAEKGDSAVVKLFLTAGIDPNSKDDKGSLGGFTALHLAVLKGDMATVKELLVAGASVNARTNNGDVTALFMASGGDNPEIMKLLLNKGADINARSEALDGMTALHNAAALGETEIVKLLIDKGADVSAKTTTYKTALDLARRDGHTEIVKLLKDAGAKE